MELFLKVVFGMIFLLTMISQIQSSSANSKPKRLQLLIKDIIAPRVKNATKEVGAVQVVTLTSVFFPIFKC